MNSDETWQEVVCNDMLAQINRLLQLMPEQRCEIFSLNKEKGLSNDEIADVLNYTGENK